MKNSTPDGYLHGFDATEQQRLIDQAAALSSFLYSGLPYKKGEHILEIGCGVGAQTKLLLEHFPGIRITSIDSSPVQLAKARIYLAPEIAEKRVVLIQADARAFPFSEDHFDGAYVCWVLEHLSQLLRVVQEALVAPCCKNTGTS